MIAKEERRRRSTESLCEKSMLLVANLIKLSTSISFAKTANNEPPTPRSRAQTRQSTTAAAPPLIPGSRRLLQEPQSRAKPIYVTKPGGFQIVGHGSPRYLSSTCSSSSSSSSSPSRSLYLIKEESDFDEGNVDGWASEYIEKVHKNRKDLDDSTKMMKKKKKNKINSDSIAQTRFRRSSSALN